MTIPSTIVQNGVVDEGEGGPWQVSVCDRGGETRSSQFEEGITAESTHSGERRTTKQPYYLDACDKLQKN